MVHEKDMISYCSLCAWRRDCKLKYRFQDSPSLYCREYTRDLAIKVPEQGQEANEREGGDVLS